MAERADNVKSASSKVRLRPLEAGGADQRERHASWLELFFDLVFVLAVAKVAQVLNQNSDFGGTLKFLALFVPVWWSWVGFAFYADRFESNEAVYRVLTFAAMLAVAALSVNLSGAFGGEPGDAPFVFCYALVRLILVVLYARAAYHVPLARSLCLQYVYIFGAAIGLWLSSLLVAPPLRYWIWAAAVALELAAPFINAKNTQATPFDRSHIPERFGLFTIIVLGEAVIATATGAAEVDWNFGTIAAASIGFAMAACVWWLNFDFVEDGAIKSNRLAPRFVYIYGHYFLVASVVALGIGVEHAIVETNKYPYLKLSTVALLCGSLVVYFAVITIIRFAVGTCHLLYPRLASIVAALLILFIGRGLPPLLVLSLLLLLLIGGVVLETAFGKESEEEEEAEHLRPCEHAAEIKTLQPRTEEGCEECVKNNYKWVHLRLCANCGHVGCCDSSIHKHATKHFRQTEHPIIASLEPNENWAWCYSDNRYVPPVADADLKSAGQDVE